MEALIQFRVQLILGNVDELCRDSFNQVWVYNRNFTAIPILASITVSTKKKYRVEIQCIIHAVIYVGFKIGKYKLLILWQGFPFYDDYYQKGYLNFKSWPGLRKLLTVF